MYMLFLHVYVCHTQDYTAINAYAHMRNQPIIDAAAVIGHSKPSQLTRVRHWCSEAGIVSLY